MKYIIFSIFLFFNFSCEQTDIDRDRFKKELEFFNHDFVNHFPDISDGKFSTYISKDGKFDVTEVFLLNNFNRKNYSENDFFNMFNSLKNSTKTIYSAGDTCLLVVNMFTTATNISDRTKASSKELKIFETKCLLGKLPVPNFWPLKKNDTTRCKLPNKFVLFVLDAKSGVYWDKRYLTDGKYMPDEWKHGYSKGIAMNNETFEVIYWFVIW
ncbi:MAG: hypothetical protein H6571_23605 [Lewinellaceae bacterium]|nr:hypothetical protein [Lewinellaceae bacterium]